MAGSQKEFELLFKLQASLGGKFNGVFKTAIDTQNKLSKSIKTVNSVQSKIDGYTKASNAISKNKAKLTELSSEHDRLQSELNETAQKKKALQNAMQTAETEGNIEEYKRLQTELNATDREYSRLNEKLKGNKNQIQQTSAKIEDQTKQLNSLEKELKETGVNTDNLKDSNTKLEKSYQKLKTAQEQLNKINARQAEIKKSTKETQKELLKTVGVIGAVATAVYAGPIKKAAEFEAKMSDVKAVSGATAAEMTLLANKAKQMGADTIFTAVEAGQAMEYMGMAGWKTKDMLNGIEGIMSLAAASGEDLGLVSDIVTDAMTAMGMAADGTTKVMGANGLIKEVQNATHFADVLAAASSNSNTNVALLGESFKYAAPIAGAYKFSIEDTALALGLMANSGIKASQSGTALRKVLTKISSDFAVAQKDGADFIVTTVNQDGTMRSLKEILDDTRTAYNGMSEAEKKATENSLTEAAKSLEISLKKENGQLKSQAELYSEVTEAMDGLTDAGKVQEAEALAGKTAMAGLLAMINASEGDYNKLADAIYNCDGAAKTMEQIKLDNYEGQLALAKSATDALQMALGEALLPTITKVIKSATTFINKAATWAQANQGTVKVIMGVVAGLAALKVGMLSAKLVSLSAEKGILSLVSKLLKLRVGFISNAATSVGFAARLKTTGSELLSYFGNIGGALKGVTSAFGNVFSNSPLISKVGSLVGKISGKMTAGFAGIAGKMGGALTGAGTKMLSIILKPFGLLGGKLGGILSSVGSIIVRSPVGKIGKIVASGLGNFATLLAPIGNVIKTVLGPLGKLGTSLLGPLGGIAGKLFPIVGIITAVITTIQLLRKNFDKVREAVGKIFGDKGLEAFDKIVEVITRVGEAVKNVFSDGNIGIARNKIQEIFGEKGVAVFDTFMNIVRSVKDTIGTLVNFITTNVVPVAEQVLQVLVTSVIPGIINGIREAAPVFMQIFQSIADFIGGIVPIIGSFIAGIMPIISEVITFIQTYVLPIVQQVFSFIVSTVLPLVVQGIQELSSIITNVLGAVLPVVQTVFQTIWSIIQPILQQILTTVQAVLPHVLSVFKTVFQTIIAIVKSVSQIFSGLIQFIQGVFTGDWSQAWNGIKSVFKGAWDGLTAIVKGVINGIIGIINGAIAGLNSIKVPDWVPKIGGKGINIPTLPTFAKGTRNTPDTFIAGEKGPELITNAPGRAVYTAQQTRDIMQQARTAIKANRAAQDIRNIHTVNNNQPQNYYSSIRNDTTEVRPLQVPYGMGGGNTYITLNNNPTVIVEGEQPDDLEETLQRNNDNLLRKMENLIHKREDDERRMQYE